jgi:HK97 family phage portal protein
MNLLERTLIANKFVDPAVIRENRVTPAIAHVNAGIMNQGINPLESVESFETTYQQITWVYAGISVIQDNIAKLPVRIYDRPANEDDRIEITDNPKFELLKKPNPFSTRYLFWATMVGSLELSGELFVYLVRNNENQPPLAAIPLRSSRIKIVPDPKEYIAGYVYKIGGMEIPFAPWEIFHVAYYNPVDDYRGQSPLQAGRNAMILELHSVNWAKDFFKSGTRAQGLLKIDGTIGREQFARIERQFNDKYTGQQKTMILEQGMDFTQTSLAPKDADFSGLRGMNKSEILAVLGVPPLMVMDLSDSSILQNVEIQRKIFWEETLLPKMEMFMAEFNTELLPTFGFEGAVAEFDTSEVEALQENREEKRKRYFEGFARGAVTPDEIRVDVFGKEPLGGATMESTYLPMNVLPIGEDTSASERAFQIAERKTIKLKQVRDQQWKAFIGRVVPIEREFVPVLVKLFRELEKEVLRNWNSQKDFDGLVQKYRQKPEFGFEALFNTEEWVEKFKEAGLPFLAAAVEKGGASVLADLVSDQVFDMTNPFVVDTIRTRLDFYGTQVIGTTQKDIVKSIAAGLKENETIEQIAKRLERQFDLAESLRAPRIARTEVTTGFNAGNVDGMRQSGLVDTHSWLTSRDADVRDPGHTKTRDGADLDGYSVRLGENFPTHSEYKGQTSEYPSDYNERCTTVPDRKEQA